MNNIKLVKIILAVTIFLCIFHVPYWYYKMIRILAAAGFCYLTYQSYINKEKLTPAIFGFCVLLFNPIIKVAFGKSTWNIIDLSVSIFLVVNLLRK